MSARVLIIDARSERTQSLADALRQAGLLVLGIIGESDDVYKAVREHNPDMILIGADSPSRDTLEGLAAIGRQFPRPILMLSESSDTDMVHAAARLGISTYAVDGISPMLLRSLMEVTTEHFHSRRQLREELEQAQRALSDRRTIDRAKYALVGELGLTEDQAYHRMRKLAMERRLKLAELARQMLRKVP